MCDIMTLSNNSSRKKNQSIPVSSLWGLVKGNVGQIQFCEALCPKLRMQTPGCKRQLNFVPITCQFYHFTNITKPLNGYFKNYLFY